MVVFDGTSTEAPVAGLRHLRALVTFLEKEPKLANTTDSPACTESVMLAKTAFKMSAASNKVTPGAALRTTSTSVARDMMFFLMLVLI
jgi:hypothetical protein